MDITNFRKALLQGSEKPVVFVLPGGEPIPAEFHVTEVGHVVKNFIDCGGTVRRSEICLLQMWVSEESSSHRLSAGKLRHILDLSQQVLPSSELDVEVEYGSDPVGQFRIVSVEEEGVRTVFRLGNKKTDCLARETCGVESGGCGCSPAGNSGQCC